MRKKKCDKLTSSVEHNGSNIGHPYRPYSGMMVIFTHLLQRNQTRSTSAKTCHFHSVCFVQFSMILEFQNPVSNT